MIVIGNGETPVNKMITVGFYKGHNATVCLLKDGQIIAAASEERFNRIKNADVFPRDALKYCLEKAGTTAKEVDLFVRIYEHPEGYVSPIGQTKNPKLMEFILSPEPYLKTLLFHFPSTGFFVKNAYSNLSKYILAPYFQRQFKVNMARFLNIEQDKIIFANHHLCHAFSAFFGFVPKDDRSKKWLVITIDGEGDSLCSTIWTVIGGKWNKIAQTQGGNSPATFYGLITHYLGMKMNEHEYKVMGLAPYASSFEREKVDFLFKGLFWVDNDLVIHSKYPSGSYLGYFDKALKGQRFDGIAAAAQSLVEDIVVDLVAKAIKKTGIKNLAVSGGFFMNIKANKKISEMSQVDNLIICPSAGDESAPFGGAYYGYQYNVQVRSFENKKVNSSQNISNLYLGPDFSDEDIKKVLNKGITKKMFNIKEYADIEKQIALLLSKGEIVGRFKGRMEWGARALGNRSILMHPGRADLKQQLNEQIKSRDFWMPFAATILAEREKDYIVNPKKIKAPFMAIGFDTTPRARKDLAAAIHPADFTCRPQILKKEDNPEYYKLIKYFENLTGIGAVLNTSFNYHGEPIVCTTKDALNTFKVTGLKYLALGNFLISKQ